jgi:hypothetical protein
MTKRIGVAVIALAAIASLGLAARTVRPSAPRPGTLSVFPVPGAAAASPRTQITFRGGPASSLGAIQVSGSRSGIHSGRIAADSDGDGASFIPSHAFQAGETVTVTTGLNILGGQSGAFHFTVATPAGGIPYLRTPVVPRVRHDVWRFHSRTDLAPAAVTLLHRPKQPQPDDIFLAPQFGPVQNGPEIVNSSGQLVWFERVTPGDMAADFRVQTYKGQPVLTWWDGYVDAGVGIGKDQILNSSYQQIATVRAGNGLSADLHEFELTPAGTALITAYYPVYWNASSMHGSSREIVLDAVVQEIDIPTGLVLFQWDSLDHVPLTASYQPLPHQGGKSNARNPFDYFHVNSIDVDDDGNLILSARNTWAAYKVDYHSGELIWTLGGKRSSFKMGPGTSFAFQHDVRAQAQSDQLLTIFDDGAGPPTVHSQSRALELALNLKAMTATVTAQRQHSPALLAAFEGNVQRLPDSDDFVGWGQQPYFTRYDQRGRLVLDGRFVGTTSTYRAYELQWSGTPAVPPAVAASTARGTTTVSASWNGATSVHGWRVLSGATATSLRATRAASQSGFETDIRINSVRYVAVEALDASGHTLGTSPAVRAS